MVQDRDEVQGRVDEGTRGRHVYDGSDTETDVVLFGSVSESGLRVEGLRVEGLGRDRHLRRRSEPDPTVPNRSGDLRER